MTRPSGGFPDDLLIVSRSFLAGCFGCFGATSALLIVVVTAIVVFPLQFTALVQAVSIRIITAVSAVQTVSTVQVVPTVCPSSVVEVVPIEVIVTQEGVPEAPRIVELKVPVQQPPFICVRSLKAVAVRFSIRIVLPNGQTVPFNGEFVTDPSGKIVCLGPLTNMPSSPGVVRIDAVIGSTVVGSTVLTLVNS